ncbi:MAG: GerMN domain-containing protein [Ktedonobacterales bacterium]
MNAPRRLSRLGIISVMCSLALVTLVVAGCSSSSSTAGGTPTATSTAPAATATTAAATVTSTPGGYLVKVYFSRHPDTDNNPAAVFPVDRTAPNLQVATYAIQQLIAGPTASETAAHYFTPLPSSLTGSSNCGGPDFQITLDMKGTTPEAGTATLRFCRPTQLAGDLTGGIIKAEINATLKQFSTIHKVVILNSSGSCFDDLSGQNLCLH